jgi:hypothetical protein
MAALPQASYSITLAIRSHTEGFMQGGRTTFLHNRIYLVLQHKIMGCMSCQKGVRTYLHNRIYMAQQRKIVGCMSCQKGVILMLLYTEIQTVTFGRMNTKNAHLSNQISVRI